MICGVVALVLAHRDAPPGQPASDREHCLGHPALGRASGLAEHARHGQSMTVLHSDMPHVGQLRLATCRLAIQPAVGIGCAPMCIILAGLAVEVRAIPVTAVLRTEASL